MYVLHALQEKFVDQGAHRGLLAHEIAVSLPVERPVRVFLGLEPLLRVPDGVVYAVDIQQALNQLLQESGSRYDRHIVAALFHIAENRSDWSEWQEE